MACAALAVAPAMADEGERMIAEVNELRAAHGVPPLAHSEHLSRSSTRFAAWQMRSDWFGHLNRIRTGGTWSVLGETIAMHGGHRPRVPVTVRRWRNSASHVSLLLSPLFAEAGAGLSHGRFGRGRATIWVLQLGTR
jgi:uncharacterized protein YkwD